MLSEVILTPEEIEEIRERLWKHPWLKNYIEKFNLQSRCDLESDPEYLAFLDSTLETRRQLKGLQFLADTYKSPEPESSDLPVEGSAKANKPSVSEG